jgi:SNF2 family DNA or RNA helicase
MLRRVKEDVAKDIPAKEETVIDVELTSVQKQYYRAIFEHNHAFLNLGGTRVNAPKLMNIQMELRKVCNHPFLLDGIEHRETDRLYKEFTDKGAFEGKTPAEQHHMLTEHGYVMSSGKSKYLRCYQDESSYKNSFQWFFWISSCRSYARKVIRFLCSVKW